MTISPDPMELGVNSFQPLTWKKIQSLLHNSVKLNSFSSYFPGCCEAAQDVISVSQRFLLVYTPAPLSPSHFFCYIFSKMLVYLAVPGLSCGVWNLVP